MVPDPTAIKTEALGLNFFLLPVTQIHPHEACVHSKRLLVDHLTPTKFEGLTLLSDRYSYHTKSPDNLLSFVRK